MKRKSSSRLLILGLMLMFSGIVSEAQTARVVETLPDDSFIVSIDGREYRAINADKTREIQKLRIDFEAAQKINAELRTQVKEALLQRDLAAAQKALESQKAESLKADFERAREDAKRNFGLFMGERELRVEAQSFIPHGNVKGFWGKVLNVLDDPRSQAFFKIVAPLYQMARCSQ